MFNFLPKKSWLAKSGHLESSGKTFYSVVFLSFTLPGTATLAYTGAVQKLAQRSAEPSAEVNPKHTPFFVRPEYRSIISCNFRARFCTGAPEPDDLGVLFCFFLIQLEIVAFQVIFFPNVSTGLQSSILFSFFMFLLSFLFENCFFSQVRRFKQVDSTSAILVFASAHECPFKCFLEDLLCFQCISVLFLLHIITHRTWNGILLDLSWNGH